MLFADKEFLIKYGTGFGTSRCVQMTDGTDGWLINVPIRFVPESAGIHLCGSFVQCQLINSTKVALRSVRLDITANEFTTALLPSSLHRVHVYHPGWSSFKLTLDCNTLSELRNIEIDAWDYSSVMIKNLANVQNILQCDGTTWFGDITFHHTVTIQPLTNEEVIFITKLKGPDFLRKFNSSLVAFRQGKFEGQPVRCLENGCLRVTLHDSESWWELCDGKLLLRGFACICQQIAFNTSEIPSTWRYLLMQDGKEKLHIDSLPSNFKQLFTTSSNISASIEYRDIPWGCEMAMQLQAHGQEKPVFDWLLNQKAVLPFRQACWTFFWDERKWMNKERFFNPLFRITRSSTFHKCVLVENDTMF